MKAATNPAQADKPTYQAIALKRPMAIESTFEEGGIWWVVKGYEAVRSAATGRTRHIHWCLPA